MKKKPVAAVKKLKKLKPVVGLSHFPLSDGAFLELIGAYANNLHQNENKSVPAYVIVAVDPAEATRLSMSSNMVRPIDDLRALLSAATVMLGRLNEWAYPELYKDRAPRIEKLAKATE